MRGRGGIVKRDLVFSVGPGQPNRQDDVAFVQKLLNEHAHGAFRRLQVDGLFGYETATAIEQYQRHTLKMSFPDGVVSVMGPTLRKLLEPVAPRFPPVPFKPAPDPPPEPGSGGSPVDPGGQKVGDLTDAEYRSAAAQLGCEAAVIKALTAVECNGPAFDSLGRPVILFERVWFSKLTHHVWDKTNPNASLPKHLRDPNGHALLNKEYGPPALQYPRLGEAYHLDADAALRAASWGKFQIMGFNHKAAGFTSPQNMVAAMRQSVAAQLGAFVSFVQSDKRLLRAFQTKDWAALAQHYNGTDYKTMRYDQKLEQHYKLCTEM